MSAAPLFDVVSWADGIVVEIGDVRPRLLTWSGEFRTFMRDARAELHDLSTPEIVELQELPVQNRTYVQRDTFRSSELRQRFKAFVEDLWRIEDTGIEFFTGMLGNGEGSSTLNKILALMRQTIVGWFGNESSAGYVPPPLAAPADAIEPILLHADLYIPDMLLLIFDAVPNDGTGATTLLSLDKFLEVLHASRLVPREIAGRIEHLFGVNDGVDHFDELYSHLHGPNPWKASLWEELDRSVTRIVLKRGEGYRLHDRRWLHGRDSASGGRLSERFHRLVYPSRPPSCRTVLGRHASPF